MKKQRCVKQEPGLAARARLLAAEEASHEAGYSKHHGHARGHRELRLVGMEGGWGSEGLGRGRG